MNNNNEFNATTNVNVCKIAYALYKQNWINGHTNSQMRMDALRNYYEFLLKNDSKHLSYEEYLLQFGFNGNIYADYEEFRKNQYKNTKYMCKLLDIPELINIYLEDLRLNCLEEDIEDVTVDENNEDIEF